MKAFSVQLRMTRLDTKIGSLEEDDILASLNAGYAAFMAAAAAMRHFADMVYTAKKTENDLENGRNITHWLLRFEGGNPEWIMYDALLKSMD